MVAENTLIKESVGGKIGENFFAIYDTTLTDSQVAERAILEWYGESKSYDYRNETYQPKARHFTQTVWKNSEEMGFAVGRNSAQTFCAGTYYPPGNVPPYFTQNVFY